MPINIEHAKSFIEAHIEEIKNPRAAAERLGYPLETLRKDFRRKEKMSLGRFLTLARVKRAKQLLSETKLHSNEIAFRVGFSREEVAARTFKRETGMTMQAYRRSHG